MVVDPSIEARLSRMLATSRPLDTGECLELASLLGPHPAHGRAVALRLARQCDAASTAGLLALPRTRPGVMEGLLRAVRAGVARPRVDGTTAPRGLSLLVPHRRGPRFAGLLSEMVRAFSPGVHHLRLGRRRFYRYDLRDVRGTFAGRVSRVGRDLQRLVPRALALDGAELWIHGFPMARGREHAPLARHLVDAFLRYAAARTEPSRSVSP